MTIPADIAEAVCRIIEEACERDRAYALLVQRELHGCSVLSGRRDNRVNLVTRPVAVQVGRRGEGE